MKWKRKERTKRGNGEVRERQGGKGKGRNTYSNWDLTISVLPTRLINSVFNDYSC